MKTISARLPFKACDVFDIIIDVKSYPLFVPSVSKIQIIQANSNSIVAETEVFLGPISHHYISQIEYNKNNLTVQINNNSKDFKQFYNMWKLEVHDIETIIHFEYEISMANSLKDLMLRRVIGIMTEKTMNAFVLRAHELLSLHP